MSIRILFSCVDDVRQWLVRWEYAKQSGVTRKREPSPPLNLGEVMTIRIHFHQSRYRDFKTYYVQRLCKDTRGEFCALVSSTHSVELIPSALPASKPAALAQASHGLGSCPQRAAQNSASRAAG